MTRGSHVVFHSQLEAGNSQLVGCHYNFCVYSAGSSSEKPVKEHGQPQNFLLPREGNVFHTQQQILCQQYFANTARKLVRLCALNRNGILIDLKLCNAENQTSLRVIKAAMKVMLCNNILLS